MVDVHHKPHGLISLPRCLVYQVHKVQHKPRKKFSWGLKQIWSEGLESVLPMAHRTVSGATGQAQNELTTLGLSRDALRHNSLDCPVSQRNNGNLASTVDCKREQCKSEHTGHVRCTTRHIRCSRSNGQVAPNPNGRADVARTGQ